MSSFRGKCRGFSGSFLRDKLTYLPAMSASQPDAAKCSEIDRQVYPDGVDFEASVPYHRLVQELFLFPAMYLHACGLNISSRYCERLRSMARFTAAYSRSDGMSPVWGDNDDARVLPFG